MKERPEVPEEEIIEVHNSKKLDFTRPYKFIYNEWWFDILTFPLFLLVGFMTFFAARYYGLRVRGRKNFRQMKKTGCIVVSNHCHYWDTVFTSYRHFPRKLFITVVQRNFEVPFARTLQRLLRALPIPASPVGFKMITEPIGEVIKKGHHVMFLPEGELVVNSQTIHRFRPGAFYQSYIHQVPILPFVYIIKKRRLFGREIGWTRFTQVIGEPVYPPALTGDDRFPKKELDEYAEIVASWMEDRISEYHRPKGA